MSSSENVRAEVESTSITPNIPLSVFRGTLRLATQPWTLTDLDSDKFHRFDNRKWRPVPRMRRHGRWESQYQSSTSDVTDITFLPAHTCAHR